MDSLTNGHSLNEARKGFIISTEQFCTNFTYSMSLQPGFIGGEGGTSQSAKLKVGQLGNCIFFELNLPMISSLSNYHTGVAPVAPCCCL